ncbi:MAG: GDP-L-fucose synthase [Bacteriovoracaceae bacterium]|nr:GDP-L-fucose synthase [Bacteriovoracaceae bacterium]
MVKLGKNSAILVTGGSGLAGNSLISRLKKLGYEMVLAPTSKELDLRNQIKVDEYFKGHKIDFVFHLAARSGGFGAKMKAPASFLYDNIIMSCNVIEASRKSKVKGLVFAGSATIYSTKDVQPFKENSLLLGKLETINEGYALSKIAGLKLCQYYNLQYNTEFLGLVICNLYGPHDDFHAYPQVIPSMIKNFHEAKNNKDSFVEIRGSGNARREFIFVDDLTDAMLHFAEQQNKKESGEFVNIGPGDDISIKDLAFLVKDITGYSGEIKFDATKPEGISKRLLDVSKANALGWTAKTKLKEGIKKTYEWFLENGS